MVFELLIFKYFSSLTNSLSLLKNDRPSYVRSSFWSRLIKVKLDFLQFGSFIVKDGSHIRFLEVKWLGIPTLREHYPYLYNIATPNKQITLAEALSSSPPNLSWRGDLLGPKLVAWNNLLPSITNITLEQGSDVFR